MEETSNQEFNQQIGNEFPEKQNQKGLGRKILIIGIVLFFISGASISAYYFRAEISKILGIGKENKEKEVACQQDAKVCPDGSSVSRIPPKCEFAECPEDKKDSDNDGLFDDEEIKYGTDINNPDTDGDGYLDGEEVVHGYNPKGTGDLATSMTQEATTRESPEFIEDEKHYQIGHIISWGDNIVYGVIDKIETDNHDWYYQQCFVMNGEEITKKYKEVKFPIIVNNKLAFIAAETTDGRKYKEFVVFDGVEGKRYDTVENLTSLGGRVLYSTINQNGNNRTDRTISIVADNKEIKTYSGYANISDFHVVDNKIFYKVIDFDEKTATLYCFYVYGDNISEKGINFGDSEGIIIDGKLAYSLMKDKKYQIIFDNYKSKEYDFNKNYPGGQSIGLTNVNNKLAFIGRANGKEFVVFNGAEQKKYNYISTLGNLSGKLFYIASDGENEFIVYNGEEGERYEKIESEYGLFPINGKMAYVGIKNNDNYVLNIEGEEPKEYTNSFITEVREVNGKLAYIIVDKKTGKGRVIYDGKEGKEYKEVENIIDVNGKLVYWAKDDSGEFVVYDNIEQKHYQNVDRITMRVIANKLVYVIREENDKDSMDKKEFLVHEQ